MTPSELPTDTAVAVVFFRPSPEQVARIVERFAGRLPVFVYDNGGIPPEALPRLFDPFYRVEGASARARGLGIGLAIARGLVEAHGGRIRAENRPGGGARFTIELPLGTVSPD